MDQRVVFGLRADTAGATKEKEKDNLKVLWLVGSNIHVQMSGVAHIEQRGNKLTLVYSDGTTETGRYNGPPINENSNYFVLVSDIQAQRKK